MAIDPISLAIASTTAYAGVEGVWAAGEEMVEGFEDFAGFIDEGLEELGIHLGDEHKAKVTEGDWLHWTYPGPRHGYALSAMVAGYRWHPDNPLLERALSHIRPGRTHDARGKVIAGRRAWVRYESGAVGDPEGPRDRAIINTRGGLPQNMSGHFAGPIIFVKRRVDHQNISRPIGYVTTRQQIRLLTQSESSALAVAELLPPDITQAGGWVVAEGHERPVPGPGQGEVDTSGASPIIPIAIGLWLLSKKGKK